MKYRIKKTSMQMPMKAQVLNQNSNSTRDTYSCDYLNTHAGSGGGSGVTVGTILPFSGSTIPNGFMICDGSAISRTIYAELFSLIGTTYGVGDGSTTFNIPDLKGKIGVGLDGNDTDFDTLGETGGEKKHTLSIDEMPSHQHASNGFAKTNDSGNYEALITNGIDTTHKTRATGGDLPHNNMQPYVVLNYIIKVTQDQTGGVASETLPVGTEMDFDGNEVPTGWEQVTDPNSYSTTEVKTNKTWSDGKPIYRKVVNGTLPAISPSSGGTADGNVAHGISNLGTVTEISGKLLYSGNWYHLPILSSNGTMTCIRIVDNTNIVVRSSDTWSAGKDISFIVEYTKSTD